MPASLYVGNDLLPNAFIIKDETLVFCIIKIHQARPASIPTYLYEFTCFRPRWAGGYQQYLRWGRSYLSPAAARQRPSCTCWNELDNRHHIIFVTRPTCAISL